MKETNSKEMNKNMYATKKTIAQGLLDLALLISNVSQLKIVLDKGSSYPNYTFVITLISISFVGQMIVGVGMIILGRFDLNNPKEDRVVNFLNDLITFLIFLITVLTVIINAFTLSYDPQQYSKNPAKKL